MTKPGFYSKLNPVILGFIESKNIKIGGKQMDNNNLFDIKGFYPTPNRLIDKMLSGIDFRTIQSVLEPSAGSGSIVEKVIDKLKHAHSYGYNREAKWDIDTIELNQNLQYVLQGKNYRVVHDDFLTYNSFKSYNLIVMNPPFESGDKHLLKAIEMQQNGGQIICLLNSETLKNPYSNTRKDLIRKLEDYHAEIEYIQNAFYNAERKTDAEVALIKINIEKADDSSIILDDLRQQELLRIEKKSQNNNESNQLISADYIKGIVEQYNFEVQTGLKLIAEYEALKPLMISTFDSDDYSKNPILELSLHYKDNDSNCTLENSYIKQVRTKYWKALFSNKEFIGLFTSNLRQKYMEKINELRDYDFSLYNIYTIRIELSKEMVKGVEDTIIALFDEFSYQSSWDNKFSKNIHYYSGWKTNSCWKVNKKVIIRLNGFNEWSSDRFRPTDYNVVNKLTDIEKSLTYLQTGTNIEVEEIDLKEALNFAEQYGESKKVKTKFLTIDFFKKGTAHLYFNNEELLHRLNIYGSQSKNWLPPSYGKKTYNEMNEEERQTVDSFEGELSYKKVMNNKNDYILDNSKLLMLA